MATSTKDPVPDAVRKSEGDALRRLIEQAKLTQPEVAQRSGVGSKAYISQLLTGHRPLNIEQASKIAEVIGRKVDEFSPRLASAIRSAAGQIILLDEAHSTHKRPETQSLLAKEPRSDEDVARMIAASAAPTAIGRWPFERLTPEQYMQISPEGRAELETLARGMYMEAAIKPAKANGG